MVAPVIIANQSFSKKIASATRHSCLLVVILLSGCTSGCQQSSPPATTPSTGGGQNSSAVADSVEQLLSDDIRSHIWDVEHLGFVIEATVFPKLKASFNDGSLTFWKTMLADDCAAAIPETSASGSPIAGETSSFSSEVFGDGDLMTASRESFLQWFTDQRSRFQECQTSMGLVRLRPSASDFTGVWTSVWRLRISGTNDKGPVETEMDLKVTLRDLDDDIATRENQLLAVSVLTFQKLDASQEYFVETTATCGLESPKRYDNWTTDKFVPNTGGIYVTDYDLDGHLDVFVDDYSDGNRLYQGDGAGHFTDVTKTSGITSGGGPRGWVVSCWADLDNDGDDDLIVEDTLYENLGDGSFRDRSEDTTLPLTPAVGYAIADYDGDGLLDVYVCHTSAYRVGQQQRSRVRWIDDGLGIDNALFRNLGGWNFEDVTLETNTGANGSSSFAAVWLHANDDDRPDLFAINEFGVNSLMLNGEDGKFQNQSIDAVFGGFSMGVAAGDYDNDGHTDLYVANMYSKAGNRILANVDRSNYPAEVFDKIEEGTRGSKLYRSLGQSEFEVVPERDMFAYVGWAYGPTFGDFDNDGWLDIYATAGFKSEERGKPDG